MRFVLFLLIPAFIAQGCGEEPAVPKPDDLVDEEVYLNVLLEMQLLDALAFTSDSLIQIDSLSAEIFSEYGIAQEQFQRTHRFYQSQLEEQTVRIDSVIKMIERERQYTIQMRDSLSSDSK